jgi:NTE family protein
MLQALLEAGLHADLVVGSSVGAMNGAYFAGTPTAEGVEQLARIWRGLRRSDIFPISVSTIASLVLRRDFRISQRGLRRLVNEHLPCECLEDTRLPMHVVSTDILTGETVVISRGNAADAILASTAIPGAFAPLRRAGRYLADGAVSSNTPIRVAVREGARRLVVLPTGHSCALPEPPRGSLGMALHALTLLISRQLVSDIETIAPTVSVQVVPPLCPFDVSPYDFSRTADMIALGFASTRRWIAEGGLQSSLVPPQLRPHGHGNVTAGS